MADMTAAVKRVESDEPTTLASYGVCVHLGMAHERFRSKDGTMNWQNVMADEVRKVRAALGVPDLQCDVVGATIVPRYPEAETDRMCEDRSRLIQASVEGKVNGSIVTSGF